MLKELTNLLEELDSLSDPATTGEAAVGETIGKIGALDGAAVVKAVAPQLPLARSVTNVISLILFAQRLADNVDFREINRLMLEDVVSMNPIAEFIPWYYYE